MLSRITSISPAGISRRIAASTRSVRRAVSSMRVPVCVRRWRVNCPLSVSGKKFWPSRGEQERGCTDGQEHRDEDDAAGYQECEQSPVAVANPLEPPFE